MNYKAEYEKWIKNEYFNESIKEELLAIKDNEKEILDRFYKNLDFGTGGLRGVIGAGSNRINIYTVRRASFGLGNYILKNYEEEGKKRGVVIAYDSRYMSKEFCQETAKTLASLGIRTYIFDSLRPTPQLSFSIRELGCVAGVVITASHNPSEYNGYKVYGCDGGQACPKKAEEIIKEVNKIDDYCSIPTMSYTEGIANGMINILDETYDNRFIDAVKAQIIRPDIIDGYGDKIKIVFTPLHGTGNKPIRKTLEELGFKNVVIVKEQENPDPNFSTVKSPNPEEREAFTLAIELAKMESADIIIGTDPDCDRVGVVVKNSEGEYIVLTGNQVGSLLVNYVISNKVNNNQINIKNNPVIIKTIVTSEFGAEIAKSYGVESIDTLTGFKFIGEKIHEFEQDKENEFVMGYEESCGYLVGTHVRDKDGVVAAAIIAEMATYYYSKGVSLCEGLIELYEKYGYYKEYLKSITLKGIDGMDKIDKIMTYFRKSKINEIGNIKIKELKDYSKGIEKLPKSDVLKFILENNSWIAIRPSGTEPKIKFYFGCKDSSLSIVNNKIETIKDDIENKIQEI